VLVPFTSTAGLATSMPPSAYLAALAELARLEFTGPHIARALGQIGAWLAGPSELVLMVPINIAAIAIVLRVAAARGADPWLRLVAAAVAVQHCVGIFFIPHGRYYYLTWLLTLLVVTAWLEGEGLVTLRRWFPTLMDRIARHPASGAIRRLAARTASAES